MQPLRTRAAVLVLLDSLAWVLALVVTTLGDDRHALHSGAGQLVLTLLALQLCTGWIGGLYSGRWQAGSFEEGLAATGAVATGGSLLVVLDLLLGSPVPLRDALGAVPLVVLLAVGSRSAERVVRERRQRAATHADATRVIVFGAGDGGASIVAAMQRDRSGRFVPVAILDDDPAHSRLRLHGVPVLGTRAALDRVARATRADMLVVAIPSAGAELVSALHELAARAGLPVRVLPTVHELVDGAVGVHDIRPVSYADLLGRREVTIDVDSIGEYLHGKRVLVTGAGGSIGSELCRQLQRYAPASLVMLDRDESALHGVELSIYRRALLTSRDLVVADIRDRQRMGDIFAEHQPQVVFHAAALKHLPLLEMHPDEAVKTNVWGTWNVLEAAAAAGVERFVNISTDKAAEPVSMLGYSKRLAERLTAWFSTRSAGTFLSVRFGNVLGSRGSVLTAFESQVATGGPVTVTDPEVTRFFMTVEEAVHLVIQAGAVGRDGEALVLDMGDPVRIDDVARRLAADSGRGVEVVYTGLRPGEKLHEVLFAADEPDDRPVHPQISHVPVPPLPPADARRLDPRLGRGALIALSKQMVAARRPPAPGVAFDGATGRSTGDLPLDLLRRASDPLSQRSTS